jgi:hypothetical protein
MKHKMQNLISILAREEELFREYSRILSGESKGSDKSEIMIEMESRLEKLTTIAQWLEGLSQMLTEISQESSDFESRDRIGQIVDVTTSRALDSLSDLGEVINRTRLKAQERSRQTERLIDRSSQILSETSNSLSLNLIGIRYIPKGEPVC